MSHLVFDLSIGVLFVVGSELVTRSFRNAMRPATEPLAMLAASLKTRVANQKRARRTYAAARAPSGKRLL